MFTTSAIAPDPSPEHEAPSDAVQVHVVPTSALLKVSLTVAPTTSLGPVLVTTIV